MNVAETAPAIAATTTDPASTSTSTSWWPSRYGADDQIGSLNEIGTDSVVRAASLVRTGAVLDLAHVLDENSPAFPGRTFRQWLHEHAPDGGLGENHVHWVAERFEATMQMGTHVDALNHLHDGDRTYNGYRLGDIVNERGTIRFGAESMPQVVTRGLLLDITAVRGVDHLNPGDVITPADAEAALATADLTIEPGDAVLWHTGWGTKWDDDPAAYTAGEPGPGMAMVDWLARRRVAITGCDTWSFGPVPSEDPDRRFAVPQLLNTRHGVVIMENLRLRELARHGPRQFMFVMSHPKLRGATGAWIAPLAIF
jgi:kynurenine formamidase